VPLLLTGLAFRGVTGGWGGLINGLEGFAVGFGLLFVLWLIGGGGGGDVKFMAAVGAWLGPLHLIAVFVLTAILLLLFSIGMIISRLLAGESLRPNGAAPAEASASASRRRGAIPYAVPATAAIVLWLVSLLLYFRPT
jgi:prepilin peptidase CpaA